MAFLHSTHSGSDTGSRPRLHPAIGLLGGFGFIVGMALAVHVLFSLLT